MRQRDCCAGQISILHPTELGTSVLKLPPTSSQDVNWWCYSKNTISRITALLCWAAALPRNVVISQNVTLHSQRHWKRNYKQHTAALQFELFGFHFSPSQKKIDTSIAPACTKKVHCLLPEKAPKNAWKANRGKWPIEISFHNITKKTVGSNWIFLMR